MYVGQRPSPKKLDYTTIPTETLLSTSKNQIKEDICPAVLSQDSVDLLALLKPDVNCYNTYVVTVYITLITVHKQGMRGILANKFKHCLRMFFPRGQLTELPLLAH